MEKELKLVFSFIDGYDQDLNTQIKLYIVLYNIFRNSEVQKYDVLMKLLNF